MIFRDMGKTSRLPRLHVVPDMDWQHKEKTQVLSPVMTNGDYLFTDERAMRKPVDGAISRGQLTIDSEMFRGMKKGYKPETDSDAASTSAKTNARLVSASLQDKDEKDDKAKGKDKEEDKADGDDAPEKKEEAEDVSMWITEFPEEITVDSEFVHRGQLRFNIYCSACHGYDANGNGLVNQRAMALGANGQAQWTAAKSLHDPVVKDDAKNPLGRIFDTITHGRNTMGPYGSQIPVEDRWAIVAYVKALQQTGIQPLTSSDDEEDDNGDEEKADAKDDADAKEKTS